MYTRTGEYNLRLAGQRNAWVDTRLFRVSLEFEQFQLLLQLWDIINTLVGKEPRCSTHMLAFELLDRVETTGGLGLVGAQCHLLQRATEFLHTNLDFLGPPESLYFLTARCVCIWPRFLVQDKQILDMQ